jgi:hypothetical protein
MVLLVLPPADHLWIGRNRANSCLIGNAARWANIRAERLPKIPVELGRGCVSSAPQLKRAWSLSPEFGSDPGNPRELSKG